VDIVTGAIFWITYPETIPWRWLGVLGASAAVLGIELRKSC
jgi:hypothetical protein